MKTKIENESILTLAYSSQLFEIDKLYTGTSGIIKSLSIMSNVGHNTNNAQIFCSHASNTRLYIA